MAGVTFSFGQPDKNLVERREMEKEWERKAAEDRAKGEMLVDIGKECSFCHVKAYVPFTCSKCGLSFCSQHHLNHNCAVLAAEESAKKLRPRCPLCGREVDVKAGESPDDAVSKHIDAGCPKPLECVTFACCCPGCRKEEVVPCICNLCGKNTCFKHRFPADHYCKRTLEKKPPSPVEPSRKIEEKKPAAKKPTASPVQDSRSLLFQDVQKKTQKKNSGLSYKLHLSKARASALGDQSIPQENREYLEVFFPLSSKAANGKPPVFMFFNVNWTIGKMLDIIATKGSVVNKNHIAGAPKLVLIALLTGKILPTSKTLKEVMKEGLLRSNDPILLDTEDILTC